MQNGEYNKKYMIVLAKKTFKDKNKEWHIINSHTQLHVVNFSVQLPSFKIAKPSSIAEQGGSRRLP